MLADDTATEPWCRHQVAGTCFRPPLASMRPLQLGRDDSGMFLECRRAFEIGAVGRAHPCAWPTRI